MEAAAEAVDDAGSSEKRDLPFPTWRQFIASRGAEARRRARTAQDEALQLRIVEGLSYDEIAQRQRVTRACAWKRIQAAIGRSVAPKETIEVARLKQLTALDIATRVAMRIALAPDADESDGRKKRGKEYDTVEQLLDDVEAGKIGKALDEIEAEGVKALAVRRTRPSTDAVKIRAVQAIRSLVDSAAAITGTPAPPKAPVDKHGNAVPAVTVNALVQSFAALLPDALLQRLQIAMGGRQLPVADILALLQQLREEAAPAQPAIDVTPQP